MTVPSPTGSRSVRQCAPALMMLAFAFSTVGASTQDTLNEKRLASSVIASLPADISYTFDPSLNTTHATYKTSLGSKGFFKRVFKGSPAVHTLIVSYDFDGRRSSALPEGVQVTLISDEDRADAPENTLADQNSVPLEITVDGSSLRYSASISRRIATQTDSVWRVNRSIESKYPNALIEFNPRRSAHVHQTATAWIPIREFLTLTQAEKASGSIGRLDFQFSNDALSSLRRFAAVIAPGVAPAP